MLNGDLKTLPVTMINDLKEVTKEQKGGNQSKTWIGDLTTAGKVDGDVTNADETVPKDE